MIVRKRRNKNSLMPIRIYAGEAELAKRLGLTIEQYVKEYVKIIAKERKWKWYLDSIGEDV